MRNKKNIEKIKKKVTSPLSIIDYMTIMNTSHHHHRMLNQFYEASHAASISDLSSKNKHEQTAQQPLQQAKPMHMFLNSIQKQATMSEQMASLFGSSMCVCYLCRMKTIDSKRILHHNYEITPNKVY